MNPTWHSSRGSLFCGFYKNERPPPPNKMGLFPILLELTFQLGRKLMQK